MALRIRGRIARLLSASVVDQALLSGANFLVGVILVRFTSDRDYALYVLLQATLVLVTSLHNALVCKPLAVLAPRKTPELRREMIGAVRKTQNRRLWPLLGLALAATALGRIGGMLSTSLALVTGFGILAAWTTVQSNYIRNVLLIYSRVRTLVAIDGLYVAILLIGILWAAFGVGTPAVWLAVALMAAAGICAAGGNRAFANTTGWVAGDAGAIWAEMRSLSAWAVIGSVIYWAFSRSYNYILASRLDLSAVASVNAVRLMVMPAVLIPVGLQGMLTPLAAAWNAEEGFDKLVRRLLRLTLLVGALYLVYFALIWAFRDWVTSRVFHKQIVARDFLLLLWIIVSLVALVREILVSALYAVGHFKWLAWQIGCCAAVALAVMWFGIPFWGAAAVLIALIVGEVLNVAGIIYLIRRSQQQFRLCGSAVARGIQ